MRKPCLICGQLCGKSMNRYCSKSCFSSTRKKRISLTCDACGVRITRTVGQRRKTNFCSRKCAYEVRKGKPFIEVTPEISEAISKRMKILWSNPEFRKRISEINKGTSSPVWKGGKRLHKSGYVMIRKMEHPRAKFGYVFEHILVAEESLGRFLDPCEVIHHINEVKNDNRPENLYVFPTTGKHTSYHRRLLLRKVPPITQSNLPLMKK